MFISKEKVREIERGISSMEMGVNEAIMLIERLQKRLDRLECPHNNWQWYSISSSSRTTTHLGYKKICKDCGKVLGHRTLKQKLQEEKKQHQKELKRINKMLKEVE
jgi:hypothetical protein